MTSPHLPKGLALVTGASSGIGAAYARALAGRGCDLVLVARRTERLKALAGDLAAAHGIQAKPLKADLSTEAGIKKIERRLDEDPATWLVHAAGFGTRGKLADVDPAKIGAQTRLHAEAAIRLARAALPGMLAKNTGSIVLVSSLAAFFTATHYTSYSATKAYLNMLAQGLADELTGTGIHVQALCPGLVRTEFMSTPEFSDYAYENVPGLFWQEPDQVAAESLSNLGNGRVVHVCGPHNRAFVAAMHTPVIGQALSFGLSWLSRRS